MRTNIFRFLGILAAACLLSACDGPHTHSHHPDHPHSSGHHGQGFHHRFETAESWSKIFDAADRDNWQKPSDVVSLMNIREGMTVADIGAGTGYFEPYLSRAVGSQGKVIAIDVEADMVRFMKERMKREALHNVDVRKGEPTDPQLADQSCDRILIVDTWHHIDDRSTYAQKLRKALKQGGSLIVIDFTLESAMGPPKQHRIAPATVMEELKAGGFASFQFRVEQKLPNQYVLIATDSP